MMGSIYAQRERKSNGMIASSVFTVIVTSPERGIEAHSVMFPDGTTGAA